MSHFLLTPLSDAAVSRQPLPPATGTSESGTLHVLEPGQSMEEAAGIHGMTEHALRVENDLGPGQAVYPGTPLRIPAQPSPALEGGEPAQTAALRPFAPDTDGDVGTAGQLTWVPDFKSMSPADIQKYLKSPEFKQMAATEREVAERLYSVGMKQTAAEYLAAKMKDMPPEVAARFAAECKALLGQLAKEAAGDKKMYAVFAEMASLLLKSPSGPGLLREFASSLAGAMSDQQVREFLRTIHQGANEERPLKILILKELLARVEKGTLKSVQALELRNCITELVKEVYQEYKSAQDAKSAKDMEFAAMLARLGNSLTNEQKQELYRKFVSDPENAAIYEKATSAAVPMAEIVAVAAREVVATILNRYEVSDIPGLIGSLARYGQGIAAVEVLLAVKAMPAALAQLEKTGVNVAALERTAGASAIAQATLQNGGDVKSGLNALFEALKGSFDDVDGVIGKLEKLLALFPEDRCPNAKELAEILGEAGPLRNLVGGILSMAVALTASSPEELRSSMRALIELGAATTDTASGLVAILSHFASESGRVARFLEGAAVTLRLVSAVLGLILTSMSVGESLERQMEEGELNWADMFNIVSGLVAIAATLPTPASPFLAAAAVILSVAGQVISDFVDEQEMQAQIKKYLGALGFDEKVAETIAANPEPIKQLGNAGFTPEQIVALARLFPAILSNKQCMLGLDILTGALKSADMDVTGIAALLSGMDETGLRHLLEAIAISPVWGSRLGRSHDRAALINTLNGLAGTSIPAEARAVIQKMLEQLEAGS